MNPKIFFSLLFGFPTIILAYVYYDLGISNLWQLFLFCWAVIMAYMPGMIMVYTLYVRNNVQRALTDFVDPRAQR